MVRIIQPRKSAPTGHRALPMTEVFMKHDAYYGAYGGQFLPEILTATIRELEQAFAAAKADPAFTAAYERILSTYSCRPTPLTPAENLSRHFGRGRFYVKREDLTHTGSHKLNNVIGQG